MSSFGHAAPRQAQQATRATDADPSHPARSLAPGGVHNDAPRGVAPARRKSPAPRSQCECQTTMAAIRDNDEAQQHADARGVMESLEQDTLSLRKRYRELRC